MRRSQKCSPKYWIVHNPNSNDVYLSTASKSLHNSIDHFNESARAEVYTFEEQFMMGIVACDLFEINFAKV